MGREKKPRIVLPTIKLLGLCSARCLTNPNFVSGILYLRNRVEGPKWASFCNWGYVLPKFAQLTGASYYASSSASYYGISLLNQHNERPTRPVIGKKKPR